MTRIIQIFTGFFIFIRVNQCDPCHPRSIPDDEVCTLLTSEQYISQKLTAES